jgi:hypothetical protein
MFTDTFLSVSNETIADSLKTDGVFCARGALGNDFVHSIADDVARTGYSLNRNWPSAVYANQQMYLCHMFAVSRAFTDFATHPRLLAVFDHVLGRNYRLKCHRYYETYGGHHMHWHTDNKTDRGFARIPGLVVIAYVNDVSEGQFQYVRGSHHWSGEKGYNDYSDAFVEDTCGKEILNFAGPKGTRIHANKRRCGQPRRVGTSRPVEHPSRHFQPSTRG